jgi:hypothetical protein
MAFVYKPFDAVLNSTPLDFFKPGLGINDDLIEFPALIRQFDVASRSDSDHDDAIVVDTDR